MNRHTKEKQPQNDSADSSAKPEKKAVNEECVPLEYPELQKWIKVIRPSRSAETYEKVE